MTAKKPGHAHFTWRPAEWDLADARAIQQLALGEATPEQQLRALKWIVEKACMTYEIPYDPDSERNSCYGQGRRAVGSQIVKLTKINLANLKEKTE